MSFVKEVFDVKYNKLLGKRSETFRQMFSHLEGLKKKEYTIVETGCCRIEGSYDGDGQSTVMFDEFVNYYGGKVYSVDISERSCEIARKLVSEKTKIVCKDSVEYLIKMTKEEVNKVDLWYLDSYDLEWKNPDPSSFHHLKEFWSIKDKLENETLVVVDDNMNGVGKGGYIAKMMEIMGIKEYFSKYQIGWKIEKEKLPLPRIVNLITFKAKFLGGLHKDINIIKEELLECNKNIIFRDIDYTDNNIQYCLADINIFVEKVTPNMFSLAPINVLIPNPDFYYPMWNLYLDCFDYILCKTKSAYDTFAPKHKNKIYIGWTSKSLETQESHKDFRKIINVTKKADFILDTWRTYKDLPNITILYNPETMNLDTKDLPPNVTLVSKYLSDSEFSNFVSQYGIHLCPSEFEGFGHYINEARSIGSIVVTTNGKPMNELINDKNGFLINHEKEYERYWTKGYTITKENLYKIIKEIENTPIEILESKSKQSLLDFHQDRNQFKHNFKTWFTGLTISYDTWLLNQNKTRNLSITDYFNLSKAKLIDPHLSSQDKSFLLSNLYITNNMENPKPSNEDISYANLIHNNDVLTLFSLIVKNRTKGKFSKAYYLLQHFVTSYSYDYLTTHYPNIINWDLWYELIICAYYQGLWLEGLYAYRELLNRNKENSRLREEGKLLVENLKYYGNTPLASLFVSIDNKIELSQFTLSQLGHQNTPIINKLMGTVKLDKSLDTSDEIKLDKSQDKSNKSLNIAILCYRWSESWDGEKTRKEGIGGSEECVVYLAENLAKMGHKISIYGEVPDKSSERFPWSNPCYYSADDFDNHIKKPVYFKSDSEWKEEFDAVIVWRQRWNVSVKNFRSKRILLWEHDIITPDRFSVIGLLPISNTVWVSKYQEKEASCIAYDELYKSKVIPNGVNIDQFYDLNLNPIISSKRDPNRCIYASNYTRGLKHLLKLWPTIKKEFPDKYLDIYYGWESLKTLSPAIVWELKTLIKSVEHLDVREHGRIGQDQLAKEFLTSGFWLYPCDFPETFCITAVKAQLGGSIPVYHNFAALQTSVKFGFPSSSLDSYLLAIRKAFNTPEQDLNSIRNEMKSWVISTFSWSVVSQQWLDLILSCPLSIFPSPFDIHSLESFNWKSLPLFSLDQLSIELFNRQHYNFALSISNFIISQSSNLSFNDISRLKNNNLIFKHYASL